MRFSRILALTITLSLLLSIFCSCALCPHSDIEIVQVEEGTCLTDGVSQTVCKLCGAVVRTNKVVARGHVGSDWIIDQEPTESEPGKKHTECTVCGQLLAQDTFEKPYIDNTTPGYPEGYYPESERTADEFDDPSDAMVAKYYEYTWSTTNLNVEISEHSANGELVSRTRRYLAGGDASATEPIDAEVRTRNARAEAVTRTKINYIYLPDVATNAWGKSMDRIAKEAKAGAGADIYVNFIYDMVGASLQKAFANLRSTTMYGASGKNYFEFTEAGYDADVDDEGYMYDLMNSLSLSTEKMYILASDYMMDTVRAFFVTPVNIEMINSIDPSMVEMEGYGNGDGYYGIDEFYEEVIWNCKWDYDAVKAFSIAVAVQAGETPRFEVDSGDVFGFALGSTVSNIHSAGMLYSTDVQIIRRELGDDGFYDVYYYESAEDSGYAQFCDALADLFSTGGVYSVDIGTTTYTPEMKITEKFAANQLLFGGVICAGNLELPEYQSMNATGAGFAIAPVPMYREFDWDHDVDNNGQNRYYRTGVYNIAKVAGISYSTTKFKQASAWLDYQSTHSTDILNKYFEDKLQYSTGWGDDQHSVDVLVMLRDNVSTALDKTYDDAIKAYSGIDYRWCYIVRSAKYQEYDISTRYTAAVQVKQDYLNMIAEAFEDLPN